MPLRRYGVLVGRAVAGRAEGGTDTPHFQIHLRGGGEDFRVAVNVLSQQSPPELLYLAVDNFTHPVLAQLTGLPDGYTEIESIVAALVNPIGPAPEPETVTLLNPGAAPVDLTGWSLADRLDHRMPLAPSILPPGETLRVPLTAPIQLSNRGGTITLQTPALLKADGVSYTESAPYPKARPSSSSFGINGQVGTSV
jgi:hypothetical protein